MEATSWKNIRKHNMFSISRAHGFSEVQPWIFPASGFHGIRQDYLGLVGNADVQAFPLVWGMARNSHFGPGLRFFRCRSRTSL